MKHSSACSTAARPCLSCKLRAWRDGSASLGVSIPEGWRGPSRFQREKDHVQELKDAGVPFDRAPR